MTKYDLLKYSKPISNAMFRSGLLSMKLSQQMKFLDTFNDYKKLNDCSDRKAVIFTAKYYRVHMNTVWVAIRNMKEEIKWP